MTKLDLQLQLCLGILTSKIFAKNNHISINDYIQAASNWKGQNDLGAFPFYFHLWYDGLPPSKDGWFINTRDLGFNSDWILIAYTKQHIESPNNAKLFNMFKILAPDKQWSNCDDYIEQNKAFITHEAYKNYCNNIENADKG